VSKWYTGSYKGVANAKVGNMDAGVFEYIYWKSLSFRLSSTVSNRSAGTYIEFCFLSHEDRLFTGHLELLIRKAHYPGV
jgi:hypothetical protein